MYTIVNCDNIFANKISSQNIHFRSLTNKVRFSGNMKVRKNIVQIQYFMFAIHNKENIFIHCTFLPNFFFHLILFTLSVKVAM